MSAMSSDFVPAGCVEVHGAGIFEDRGPSAENLIDVTVPVVLAEIAYREREWVAAL